MAVNYSATRKKIMDLKADLVQIKATLKSKQKNGTYNNNTDGVLMYGVENCMEKLEDLRARLAKYEAYY